MNKLVEFYDSKCCEDKNLHEYSDDCECCVNTCGYCAEQLDGEEYPQVLEVLPFVAELAPKDWIITHEYPNFIGVKHPSLEDDRMICLGDLNKHFAFNDSFTTDLVCGEMKFITNPKEIAESFWNQVSKIYPQLTAKESN